MGICQRVRKLELGDHAGRVCRRVDGHLLILPDSFHSEASRVPNQSEVRELQANHPEAEEVDQDGTVPPRTLCDLRSDIPHHCDNTDLCN